MILNWIRLNSTLFLMHILSKMCVYMYLSICVSQQLWSVFALHASRCLGLCVCCREMRGSGEVGGGGGGGNVRDFMT